MRLSDIRRLMFVGMLCASFAAMQAGVLARSGYEHYIYDFCDGWVDGDGYDCQDCGNFQGTDPDFEASGSCDFTGIERLRAIAWR